VDPVHWPGEEDDQRIIPEETGAPAQNGVDDGEDRVFRGQCSTGNDQWRRQKFFSKRA